MIPKRTQADSPSTSACPAHNIATYEDTAHDCTYRLRECARVWWETDHDRARAAGQTATDIEHVDPAERDALEALSRGEERT